LRVSIRQYLKEIGRGKDGARSLARAQAADLFGQVLDGAVSDLEIGAFCIAMRVKGETAEEMCGFLDATQQRLQHVTCSGTRPAIVLPSYNGARRLPALTPLLALLLAREGLPVLVHGTATEAGRVSVREVFEALGVPASTSVAPLGDGQLAFVPTELLSPGLKRLLDARRAIGLRNSAHSLVKLMNPCSGPAVIVGSYTHPEYAQSMGEVFQRMRATALLLRGTEGEAVADARRLPEMVGFVRGERIVLEEGRKGTLTELPALPADPEAQATARAVKEVLPRRVPVPPSIALQVKHLQYLATA
jgi:anthranilate phosphoribosyltransferase